MSVIWKGSIHSQMELILVMRYAVIYYVNKQSYLLRISKLTVRMKGKKFHKS